ncbi:MAG: hypothetical protein AAF557_17020 [Pseudomonadota bacterium]
MIKALSWLGARAQWALAIGVIAAVFIPGPGKLLEGSIPFWVVVMTGLAMTRIDLGQVLRRAIGPRRMVRNLALAGTLMIATPVVFFAIASATGIADSHIQALVYTAAAPPLGSATAFCLMLGLDAAFALEITILGSFLAPFTMPLVARLLLGDAVPIETAEMILRLGILIGTAAIGAVILRRLLGPKTIERYSHAFDGVASICLVLFLFPLFLGLTDQIAAAPAYALTTAILVIIVNLGAQIASFPICRLAAGRETGGATSLILGNRNAALGLASLPPDPLLTIYVALYQFPMYFTPLIMRFVVGAPHASARSN